MSKLTLDALAAAHHELTCLQGMTAFDSVRPDATFVIQTKATLALIEKAHAEEFDKFLEAVTAKDISLEAAALLAKSLSGV